MGQQNPSNEIVSTERRSFLDAAFEAHLKAEGDGDIPAIVDTYAEGGHLNFNGAVYDTPEKLTAFHIGFGFSNRGILSGLGCDILNKSFTHDSVIVEYRIRGTVEIPKGSAPRRAEMTSLTIYQFNDAGKLVSERAHADTGALLPKPIVPEF